MLLGGATSVHDANSSSVLMSVTSNGDRVVRQSRKKTIYQPGKSLSIVLTGVLDADILMIMMESLLNIMEQLLILSNVKMEVI